MATGEVVSIQLGYERQAITVHEVRTKMGLSSAVPLLVNAIPRLTKLFQAKYNSVMVDCNTAV